MTANQLNLNPQLCQVMASIIAPRIDPRDFVGMTGAQIDDAVKKAYPEYRQDIALAYIDGAALAASMIGMEQEAIEDFLGKWATRDEYMLVASYYAWGRHAAQAFAGGLVNSDGSKFVQ